MNEGILPVQQMVAAGANNWFTTNGHPLLQNHTPQPHQSAAPPPLSCPASQEFPHSWSQLVLGFSGEDDKTMEQPTTYVGNLEFRPPKSSEILMKCKSGAAKKSKMNPTTSAQSGIKVRKEKLGNRITALHQLVSPFGKTDTASVLWETIGYIRFLQRQIEALSLPYLATGSGNITQEKCEEDEKRDLKSRGLCLVPLSCTLDFGSENGADYWAA